MKHIDTLSIYIYNVAMSMKMRMGHSTESSFDLIIQAHVESEICNKLLCIMSCDVMMMMMSTMIMEFIH